jgi:hypothetical protein
MDRRESPRLCGKSDWFDDLRIYLQSSDRERRIARRTASGRDVCPKGMAPAGPCLSCSSERSQTDSHACCAGVPSFSPCQGESRQVIVFSPTQWLHPMALRSRTLRDSLAPAQGIRDQMTGIRDQEKSAAATPLASRPPLWIVDRFFLFPDRRALAFLTPDF